MTEKKDPSENPEEAPEKALSPKSAKTAAKTIEDAGTREDRVAAALRANLRRRKVQARGRKADTGQDEPGSS